MGLEGKTTLLKSSQEVCAQVLAHINPVTIFLKKKYIFRTQILSCRFLLLHSYPEQKKISICWEETQYQDGYI